MDWGYEFASTGKNGLPFSPVDEAIDTGIGLGLMHSHGPLIVLTDEGRTELAGLRQMEGSKIRERYLAGAADALLVFNPGNIREAFNYDPAISYLKKGNRTDWLLTLFRWWSGCMGIFSNCVRLWPTMRATFQSRW